MKSVVGIVGATGRNAAAWIEAFSRAGFEVKNLVRDASGRPQRPGVTKVAFDLDDRAGYARALGGVQTLALVTPADPRQTERELALIDAATAAGVERIVNLSVIGADLPEPISPFARWQAAVESGLRRSRIPRVTLRPNFFMQNLLLQKASIEGGSYVAPTGQIAVSWVDVTDVADVAVAMTDGRHDGAALTLTGPRALTGEDVARTLQETSGRPVRFASPTIGAFRQAMLERGAPSWHVEALAEMYEALAAGRGGYLAGVSSDVERVTGKAPRDLRDFARSQLMR